MKKRFTREDVIALVFAAFVLGLCAGHLWWT
jgi:hypothetical protein